MTRGMKLHISHQLSRPLRTTSHFRMELVTFASSAAASALRAAHEPRFDSQGAWATCRPDCSGTRGTLGKTGSRVHLPSRVLRKYDLRT